MSKHQELVQRFFNEARAATAIKHPSIVEIYDLGWAPDGSAYIVMEFMEGESLGQRLQRLGRLPVAMAVTIARQIANALAAAHKAGIVHRDLKPDNVGPGPSGLTREQVMVILRTRMNMLRVCGTDTPTKFEVNLTIDPIGQVTAASARGNGPVDPHCVESMLHKFRFPASEAGLTTGPLPLVVPPRPATAPPPIEPVDPDPGAY